MEIKYAQGVFIKAIKTKFGEIINVGINIADFTENEMNEKGFVNFDIKKSKEGKYYAQIKNQI